MRQAIFEKFRRHKPQIVFFFIAIAILVAFLLVSTGYYPIAFVNGSFVSAQQFETSYGASMRYHAQAVKTYGAGGEAEYEFSEQEVEASVLTYLIEAELVRIAASREVGSDFGPLVEDKVGRYENDPGLARAAEALYGLTFPKFRMEILIPQAERDIFTGRLFLRGQTFDAWLTEEKQDARVFIFSRRFRWDGGKVVVQQ